MAPVTAVTMIALLDQWDVDSALSAVDEESPFTRRLSVEGGLTSSRPEYVIHQTAPIQAASSRPLALGRPISQLCCAISIVHVHHIVPVIPRSPGKVSLLRS